MGRSKVESDEYVEDVKKRNLRRIKRREGALKKFKELNDMTHTDSIIVTCNRESDEGITVNVYAADMEYMLKIMENACKVYKQMVEEAKKKKQVESG